MCVSASHDKIINLKEKSTDELNKMLKCNDTSIYHKVIITGDFNYPDIKPILMGNKSMKLYTFQMI